MKLIPGPPPEAFRESIAATYSNVAHQREEMGEAEWRWPIAERVLEILRAEGNVGVNRFSDDLAVGVLEHHPHQLSGPDDIP